MLSQFALIWEGGMRYQWIFRGFRSRLPGYCLPMKAPSDSNPPAEADEAACIKKRRHDGSVVARFTCQTRKPTSEAEARECRGLRRHVAVRYPAKDLCIAASQVGVRVDDQPCDTFTLPIASQPSSTYGSVS